MVFFLYLGYLVLGLAFAHLIAKYEGMHPNDPFICVLILAWPLLAIAFGVFWVIERTPWYKRYKRRKKFRVIVSEENEPDNSFIGRFKRL